MPSYAEQTQSTSLPAIQGTIEIVASRREQKQQQAAAAMPPPPSRMLGSSRSQTAAATSAGGIPPGVYVEITKSGETVHIPVTKQRILIGRSDMHTQLLQPTLQDCLCQQHAFSVSAEVRRQTLFWNIHQAHGSMQLLSIRPIASNGRLLTQDLHTALLSTANSWQR